MNSEFQRAVVEYYHSNGRSFFDERSRSTALVASELFGIEPADDLRLDEEIRPTIEPLVPEDHPREFNWGLLDMGAELRKSRKESLPKLSFLDLE